MDVSIWRPLPADNTFSIVGDYAQNIYYDPAGTSLIVKAINDDPSNPSPQTSDHTTARFGNDKGSGGTHDDQSGGPFRLTATFRSGSWARTVTPNHSFLITPASGKISVKTQCPVCSFGTTKDSGANKDVSIYKLEGVKGAFVAQSNYSPYVGRLTN
jgi:hypothetical protein